MTIFEKFMWGLERSLVYGLIGKSSEAIFSDYAVKAWNGEIPHVGLSKEIRKEEKSWISTQNLIELENVFKTSGSTLQKVAIIGISGSGRTTLAKQYAIDYEEKMKEQPARIRTVFFADMRDEDTFSRAYRKLAEALEVKAPLTASEETIIKKVNKKLKRRPHWLFVVDNVNVENYEKLQKFLPNNGEGQILIVTSDNLGGVKSFDIQSNTLTTQEALEIFNRNLGKNHWAYEQADSSKCDLAKELFYLPLAIKQAAIHLKDTQRNNSFETAIRSYIVKLKEIVGISAEVPLCSIDDLTRIIKAVHSLSVEECEQRQSESKTLLSILSFLNPCFIDHSILQSYFEKHANDASLFNDALNLLSRYSLIARVGKNGWEVHSSLQDLLAEKAIKEGIELPEALENLLVVLKDNFELDMRSASGLNKPKAIENQVETLLEQAKKYNIQEKLKPCFVHLYNVLGNHYLQSNNFFEACQAFEKSLKLVNVQITDTTADQICENLKAHKELPALCAQALHYLGKVYFHTQGLDQAKKYFQKAIEIQKIIRAKPDAYDTPNRFDFLIFQRQGIGWALLEGDKKDLLDAEELYLNLFKQNPCIPAGQSDPFNERYCNIQLSRVYLKLAQQEADKVKKEEYYEKARKRIETGGEEKGVSFQGAIHIKDQSDSQHVKKGEMYLVLGELYLDENCPFRDLKKAQGYFKEAARLSKTDLMIGAKSEYYLASLYLEKGFSNQGWDALTEAIQLFNKIGGKGLTRRHPKFLEEAEKIKTRETFKMLSL
ncbi:hypothetical protein NCS13_1_0673 [Neochlamydia sp. S13]|nr:hypothetical protein NCS13_1_0673 [Neochlamydia sp. S13]